MELEIGSEANIVNTDNNRAYKGEVINTSETFYLIKLEDGVIFTFYKDTRVNAGNGLLVLLP